MPHTTTKAIRLKQPDSRPNGKLRARLTKEKNLDLKIQDIRVTKTNSKEKKDRSSESGSHKAELPKDTKVVRAIKKKVNLLLIILRCRFDKILLHIDWSSSERYPSY